MSFDDELSSAPPTNSRVASPLSQQQQPAYSSAAPARAPAPAPSSAPQKQAAPVSAPVVSVQATNTEEVLLSQLRTNVTQFVNNVSELKNNVSVFGTVRDNQEWRDKLTKLDLDTAIIARNLNASFKSAETLTGQSKKEKEKLMGDQHKYLKQFQTLQAEIKSKLRIPPPVKPEVKLEYTETTPLIESERRHNFEQVENLQQFNDKMIQDREAGIQALEASVLDVNEMFHDLATMVDEQQVFVDAIEQNIIAADRNVDKGVDELQGAKEYLKKSRKKLCIILVICVIVLICVGLLIAIPLLT